jgi:hypothetical protein
VYRIRERALSEGTEDRWEAGGVYGQRGELVLLDGRTAEARAILTGLLAFRANSGTQRWVPDSLDLRP